MDGPKQEQLFSPPSDLEAVQLLIAELHDNLPGRVARFHQLNDLCAGMGSRGTMMPGGEVTLSLWVEARSSFVNGNFVATIMLCQGLAEQILAANIDMRLEGPELPPRVRFQKTLEIAQARGTIDDGLAGDLRRLMDLRNPLSHYRPVSHSESVSTRSLDGLTSAQALLRQDSTFAIDVAVRVLSCPEFRLG